MAWAWATAMAAPVSWVCPEQSTHDGGGHIEDHVEDHGEDHNEDHVEDHGEDHDEDYGEDHDKDLSEDHDEDYGEDLGEDHDEDYEHLAGLHEAERLDRFDEERSSTQSQGRPLSSI